MEQEQLDANAYINVVTQQRNAAMDREAATAARWLKEKERADRLEAELAKLKPAEEAKAE